MTFIPFNPTQNRNTNKEENNKMNDITMTDPNATDFAEETLNKQFAGGLEILRQLAGGVMKMDELFVNRKDGGKQVLKPKEMTIQQLAMHANREAEAEEQKVNFTRSFKARPSDGAVAFHAVLKEIFGINAIGKTIPPSFFSNGRKPEYKSVQIGAKRVGGQVINEYIEVPWGLMQFAPLEATFNLHYQDDRDYGFSFAVTYEAPKKYQAEVKALFDAVEQYLAKHSIYKGKVLEGVGFADQSTGEVVDPKIIDPYNTDRNKIVYTEKVSRALENSIFGVIRHADALREFGIPLGEKILLEGPNGSGKTEAGMAALQIGYEEGWTTIKVRWDEDIAKVLAFAERLGGPAVLLVEDIENLMPKNGSPDRMERLLELFDGASSKGRETMLVMTSNHAHELSKSMSRPGRIDRIVRVADLDREALERLVKVLVSPERLSDDIDYDALFDAFPECTPVWIVQAIRRAERSVIIRTGQKSSKFITDDFLYEAEDLWEQLSLHRTASDRKEIPSLDTAFTTLLDSKVAERTQYIHRQVKALAAEQGVTVPETIDA